MRQVNLAYQIVRCRISARNVANGKIPAVCMNPLGSKYSAKSENKLHDAGFVFQCSDMQRNALSVIAILCSSFLVSGCKKEDPVEALQKELGAVAIHEEANGFSWSVESFDARQTDSLVRPIEASAELLWSHPDWDEDKLMDLSSEADKLAVAVEATDSLMERKGLERKREAKLEECQALRHLRPEKYTIEFVWDKESWSISEIDTPTYDSLKEWKDGLDKLSFSLTEAEIEEHRKGWDKWRQIYMERITDLLVFEYRPRKEAVESQ